MKSLFALLFFSLSFLPASHAQNVRYMGTNYAEVTCDTFPAYPGGEQEFYNYISTNFRVTKTLRDELYTEYTQVIFSFVVDTSGYIHDLAIRNCSNLRMEREFSRLLYSMPAWSPGYKDGKKTPVLLHIPFGSVIDEFGMQYAPEASPNASTFDSSRKKRPMLKWSLIAIAILLPIWALINLK